MKASGALLTVLLFVAGDAALATLAQLAQPSCDLTESPAEYCQAYCTGKCSFYNKSLGDTGTATNITLYRLTPKNVLGIADRNTGDAPGDVGFVLANRRHVLECLQNQTQKGCFLDNSTDNIYGKFNVEIDGKIGPYYQCNPLYQNASKPFQCWQKCDTPPNCHNESGYDSWKNGTDGWAGASCFCEQCERCDKSVGRANNPYTYHGHVPDVRPVVRVLNTTTTNGCEISVLTYNRVGHVSATASTQCRWA
jgi:hypothetical protein